MNKILTALAIIGGLFCGQQVNNSNFEQVGYFSSNALRGFTVFVKTPTKSSIQNFCTKKKNEFSDKKILKIHFFDNRELTPDVTKEYFFPESSGSALIADCVSNPFNNIEEVNFHKDIPD